MAKINPAQIRKLQNYVKNQMDRSGLDYRTIDFQAHLDRELTYNENKDIFVEMLSNLIFDLEAQIQEAKAEQEKEKNEEQERLRKEEKDLIKKWKTQKLKDIEVPEFETAKHLINLTLKGFSYASVIVGEAGIGKTFLVLETIKKEMKDNEWEYFNGYTTPLSLYKTLYENKDKVIVLDDIEGIFDDNIAVSILKNALWDSGGNRVIFWNSTSSKTDGLPSHFEFSGRLIILCNKIPKKNDKNVMALLSRTNHYNLNFTYNQKLKIIQTILESRKDLDDKEKEKVMGIIRKNTDVSTINFNIRTMEKLVGYTKYNPELAEKLFQDTTENDDTERIIFEMMEKGDMSVSEQIKEFERVTGKKRTTYFAIKQTLREREKLK